MHRIIRCGNCGQNVRVPAMQQTLSVTCPNCKRVFDVPPEQPQQAWSQAQSTSPPMPPAKSGGGWVVLGVVGAGAAILFFCCVGALGIGARSGTNATATADAREQMKEAMSQTLNAHKQEIFNQLHPIGTAKNVVLHDFEFVPGPAGETHVVYRFTVYWEGPIEKNGYTKIQTTVDPEIQQPVQTLILATNGVTNTEAQAAAFDLGWLIGEAARAEQQRQAEYLRRSRGY